MKKIVWEVQCVSTLPVFKYCRKCGKKMEFTCSGQFRINAQRKYLDIWLIYKCLRCNTTWNAEIYSRISPQALESDRLDRFLRNEKELVEQYAMNSAFLHGNGVETGIPQYSIIGESFSPEGGIQLKINSKYAVPVKVSALVRGKLCLSQKEFARLAAEKRIRSIPEQDLLKCRLGVGITLVFS